MTKEGKALFHKLQFGEELDVSVLCHVGIVTVWVLQSVSHQHTVRVQYQETTPEVQGFLQELHCRWWVVQCIPDGVL